MAGLIGEDGVTVPGPKRPPRAIREGKESWMRERRWMSVECSPTNMQMAMDSPSSRMGRLDEEQMAVPRHRTPSRAGTGFREGVRGSEKV
jgi:hypothetical protein